MRLWTLFAFLVWASAWAGDPVRLPIPAGGTFCFEVPAGWKETSRETPDKRPPTVTLQRKGEGGGSLQVTVMWSPRQEADFGQEASVRKAVENIRQSLQGSTVEAELPLEAMEMRQGKGFSLTATDRNFKPGPGQYPVLTTGVFGANRCQVIFTILAQGKDAPARAEALAILKGANLFSNALAKGVPEEACVHVLEAGPVCAAFVPAARMALFFEGKGMVYRAPANGSSSPRYFYFEDAGAKAILSGWFEPAEDFPGVQKDWEANQKNWKGKPGQEPQDVMSVKEDRWEGFSYTTSLKGITRAHLKAHWVQDGTWIDVHISMAVESDPAAAGAAARELLKRLKVEPLGRG